MIHPKKLQTADYTFDLPANRIAQFPLTNRDDSKLLVYRGQTISESTYAQISDHLPSGSLLVFNNTRVIHARLLFQKPGGATIEVFLLEPAEPDGYTTLTTPGKRSMRWKALVGGASKWKHGQVLEKSFPVHGITVTLKAAIADRLPDSFVVEITWTGNAFSFAQVLEQAGSVPIPPYLKREADEVDEASYQTIYANREGSVAAPTAGLHFTKRVFDALQQKEIERATITLHVGAGTFLPVKATLLAQHAMHAEMIEVEAAFLTKLIHWNAPVFAVGTTSLRTLESLYWMGVKCLLAPETGMEELSIRQWDPYEIGPEEPVPASVALSALLQWMNGQGTSSLSLKTSLLIAPPYAPRIAQGLITNFHQPGSTLLLLVAAVTHNRWKDLYGYALAHDFRFLSYGDGCLIYF